MDNTIIAAVEDGDIDPARLEELRARYPDHLRIAPYTVFARKHLSYFIDRLWADGFPVGIWTYASKNYAEPILRHFVLGPDPSRTFVTFLWNEHTEMLRAKKYGLKDLSVLVDVFDYDPKILGDAYIVDDNPNVWETNPTRCIRIKPFYATDADMGGDSLLNVLEILEKYVRFAEALPDMNNGV